MLEYTAASHPLQVNGAVAIPEKIVKRKSENNNPQRVRKPKLTCPKKWRGYSTQNRMKVNVAEIAGVTTAHRLS